MALERIQKIMSEQGLCSRRAAEPPNRSSPKGASR